MMLRFILSIIPWYLIPFVFCPMKDEEWVHVDDANLPWEEDKSIIVVLEVKNGFVKYKYKNGSGSSHHRKIGEFLFSYVRNKVSTGK